MLNSILIDRSSYDLRDFPEVNNVLNSFSDDEIKELWELINDLKTDYLYKGLVHGIYHSEKVLMFTYLLAKKRNIEEPYRQILFDAALYHDIGREKDAEDSTHGMISANHIDPLLEGNPLYDNKYNLLLLKAIINAHSRKDSYETKAYLDVAYDLSLLNEELELTPSLEKYMITYLEMARILKDADALDRKRFGNAEFESLNKRYLRYEESENLIQFAEELNELYYALIKANYSEIDESKVNPSCCAHSIGFDFFKISSILTHGVLSQDEMKKRQLMVPRNFAGGNFDRWISVVDISLLKFGKTASKEFVERGISFVCENVKMHEPSPAKYMTEAIITGMPWNKSNHEDERYVKNKIAPENIIAINIPKNYINKSILDTVKTGNKEQDSWRMIYIYNSLDINMIRHRIKYYKNKTQTPDDSPYWLIILSLLESYEKVLINRDLYGRKGVVEELNIILDEINTNIGKMLYTYYYEKIGQANKDITVLDVVTYELSQNYAIKYNLCRTEEEATFFLELDTKKIVPKHI